MEPGTRRVYPRAVRILVVVLAAAALLAGCGAVGDDPLERSLADAVRARLAEDAPLVALRSVECTGADAAPSCVVDLDLTAQESVVRVDYAVVVGPDGCWRGRPVRVEQLGAGPGVEADIAGVDGRLAGCLG